MWNRKKLRRRQPSHPARPSAPRRALGHESLEPRMLMAANPIHVGLVYLETDYLETDADVGSDSQPDRFILSFTGGAEATELREVRIRTDKDGDGLSVGDPIFDTAAGGRGKNGYHAFQVHRIDAAGTVEAHATVADGGQELVIRLDGFRAGDRLEFTLDVDEILRNLPDLDRFNAKLDTITSGQEFEDSILETRFAAPHYETATTDSLFVNVYGDPAQQFGLNLPPDEGGDVDSRPNRSAAAVGSVTQTPKPISLQGHVWLDNDLDKQREPNEPGLAGVELALFTLDAATSQFVDTGQRAQTDAAGHYQFGVELGLPPGTYRVEEAQPAGLFSVGAVVGRIDGSVTGTTSGTDILTGIHFAQGDTHGVDYDFAEAQAAELSGFVYRDDSDDGIRDPGEAGLAGVRVQVVPVDTIAPQGPRTVTTDADGFYQVTGLAPGDYRIVELDQPAPYTDGLDTAGTIGGVRVGAAVNPGDAIDGVSLRGNDSGIEYNFGELPLGSLEGYVYLVQPGEDCDGAMHEDDEPLAGVRIVLRDPSGNTITETSTDAGGHYRFDQLPKGNYTIQEFTPAGLLDGEAYAGEIRAVSVGSALGGGLIERIELPAGGEGIDYNFCEAAPVSLSGHVYHDASDDGVRDPGESAIPDVTIELVNADGTVVAETQTDDRGQYRFAGLLPGSYSIRERQPAGYFDGLDTAGTVAGVRIGVASNPGDQLRDVVLRQGQAGVEYNFGELRPASLAGRVHADDDGDCEYDEGELLLQGVVIRLYDADGRQVANTETDADGRYRFEQLRPGRYTVVEEQPAGYFDGNAFAGSAGGDTSIPNRIGDVTLASGEVAVDYDFCEEPPAEISGYVFSDRNGDCLFDPAELPIEGVRVELLNDAGELIAETRTNSLGQYRFSQLAAGRYTVREIQPAGYLHGGQMVGNGGGDDSQADLLRDLDLGFGDRLVDYNFCELEPAAISGRVFVDTDDDCRFDAGEDPLAGVSIELRDGSGQVVAETRTDANGIYRFDNLTPGEYQVFEDQPTGYYQGGQVVGSGGGAVLGDDLLGEIMIGPGADLIDYDFCEQLGGSLGGRVWSETDRDRLFEPGETPLAGVTMELRDADGAVLRRTVTGQDGHYLFDDLAPGTYRVHEIQPAGYFHGGQVLGSVGGAVAADDLLSEISIGSGVDAVDYDFPEVPPATLSGYVFQDGPALARNEAPPAEDLRDYRDGQRTADDTPLAGVTLELRRLTGDPFVAANALPGVYPDGPIRMVTNADGFYEFTGLRPGSYHVYQVQPEDYVDGLDSEGTTGGKAVNPADLPDDIELQFLVQTLAASGETDPGNDAILNVDLPTGGESRENNFSEIVVQTLPPPLPPLENPPPVVPVPPIEVFPQAPSIWLDPLPTSPSRPILYDFVYQVSWHLSVINGGQPRGDALGPDARTNVQPASATPPADAWQTPASNRGVWTLVTRDGERLELSETLTLGAENAIPLAGDFDGDGRDEMAIFVAGQWFIDLNGNGRWDAGDLWIELGNELDRPVVGDWDGDGKDDVGIFGPEWHRDPIAILSEPGLPDPANPRRIKPKNTPPEQEEAADGERRLQRGMQGTLRADVIDHVFRYGEQPDVPLAGDWNGDGIDTIAVFRNGHWMLDADGDGRWTRRDDHVDFGQPGDQPIVGDWDGDGIDDLGVVRGHRWILDADADRQMTDLDARIDIPGSDESLKHPDWGVVSGDWDGDGRDDPGTYRTQADPPPDDEQERPAA